MAKRPQVSFVQDPVDDGHLAAVQQGAGMDVVKAWGDSLPDGKTRSVFTWNLAGEVRPDRNVLLDTLQRPKRWSRRSADGSP